MYYIIEGDAYKSTDNFNVTVLICLFNVNI